MALKNIAWWNGEKISLNEKPSACGAQQPDEKPSSCGSACGSGDK